MELLQVPPRTFNHVRVTNPFNPNERVTDVVDMPAGQQYMPVGDLFPFGLTNGVVVSVNGQLIPESQFDRHYITVDDYVVSCPVPQGGKNADGSQNKSIFRMIAMIAILIIATVFTMGMATPFIMMAGSMLVNALLPDKPATNAANNTNADQTTTQSYGIDGAKNVAAEGIPVPVCYGTFRMAGNLLDLYTENIKNTQNLYVQFNAGEGPVANISDIELNGQAVSTYRAVEYLTRLGEESQEVIPWFVSVITPESVSQRLVDDTWVTHTMGAIAEKLRLDFAFPSGLVTVDTKTGANSECSVEFKAEYRDAFAGGQWIPFEDANSTLTQPETTTPVTVPGGINPDTGLPLPDVTTTQTVQQTTPGTTQLIYTDKSRSAVRCSFMSPDLPPAIYQVRVMRMTGLSTVDNIVNDAYLTDINRILLTRIAYNNTALVGLKIQLTDQLSAMPTVTYLNHGRIIRTWDTGTKAWVMAASSNPAWICLDMMTATRYGGGMLDSRIDLEQWKAWAEYCDAEALTFNGVIDSQSNLWDAMQYVLRCGRAQVFNIGTKYSVVIEKPTTPSMMFTSANMIEGSYKETWLPAGGRANEIEVSYFDENDGYKQHTVKVYDSYAIASAKRQNTANITLVGVTTPERAWKEGALHLNFNRYILKTVDFEAPLDALGCTVGDTILVQNDMANFAYAGKIGRENGAANIILDRTVPMEAGKTYSLLVAHAAVQRAAGVIQSISLPGGSETATVMLTNFNSAPPEAWVQRLVIPGLSRDIAIRGLVTNGVEIDAADAAGLFAAMPYTAHAIDVLEERQVVTEVGNIDYLTLVTPFTDAPGDLDNWLFGETTKVKQEFRVKAIEGSNHEYTRRITGIQYDERAYTTDGVPGFGNGTIGGAGDPTKLPISHAHYLAASESTYINGQAIKTEVTLTWSPGPYGIYKGADVYVSVNDGPSENKGQILGVNPRFVIEAGKDTKLTFKVVAFDLQDKHAMPDAGAPFINYIVVGIPPDISRPPVTGMQLIWSGKHCQLFWRYNATSAGYEFGSEQGGADAGSLDPQFKDYEVRVIRASDKVLLRTEHVTASNYTYYFDGNHDDNANAVPPLGPQRDLVFEVYYRDVFNKLGVPGVIDAYNPPPVLNNATVKATPGFAYATISFDKPTEPDFEGCEIWLSSFLPVATTEGTAKFDGPGTSTTIAGLGPNTQYFYKIGAYDTFGKDGMIPQGPFTFSTGLINIDDLANSIIGVDTLDPALRARISLVDGDIGLANSVNARILTETTARVNALLGEATARAAAIATESTARVTADAAVTDLVNIQASRIDGNTAAIVTETNTRATAVAAVSTRVDALVASTSTADSLLAAAITSEQVARTNADTAQASQISVMSATVNSKITTFFASTAPTATAIGDIWFDTTNGVNSPHRWNGTTWVDVTDNRTIQNNAAIIQINNVSASSTSAAAQATYALTTTVGGHTTTLATQQTSLNGLSAQYTVKIDNNGYVSGFGLASTAVNGVPVSEFEILADKFSVRIPGYPKLHPFTVGQYISPADGSLVYGAVMTNAAIGVACINTANIADASVGTLKIGGLAASIPISVYDGSTRALNASSYTAIWAYNITNDDTVNRPMFIQFMVDFTPGSGGQGNWVDFQIVDNGTVVGQIRQGYANNIGGISIPCSGTFFTTPGSHTIIIQAREQGPNINTVGSVTKTTTFGAITKR